MGFEPMSPAGASGENRTQPSPGKSRKLNHFATDAFLLQGNDLNVQAALDFLI